METKKVLLWGAAGAVAILLVKSAPKTTPAPPGTPDQTGIQLTNVSY